MRLATIGYFGPAELTVMSPDDLSPLRGGHFERWITLWTQTVDELFAGPRAQAAKSHAFRLANAFRMRLASHPSAADDRGTVRAMRADDALTAAGQ